MARIWQRTARGALARRGRHGRAIGAALLLLAAAPAAAQERGWPAQPDGDRDRAARGLLKARSQAILSSEIAGRVLDMPVAEGGRFARGALLVRIDCAAYDAQLAAARAAETAARHQLDQKTELLRLRSAGTFDVGLAEARLDEARAQTRLAEVATGRCQILAPFDGAVVERRVSIGESVVAGTAAIEIVDQGDFEIRILAPSAWLAWMRPQARFSFQVDETGEALPGRIEAIGARIDAASQTILLVGRLDRSSPRLVAGMSGTARFDPAGPAP